MGSEMASSAGKIAASISHAGDVFEDADEDDAPGPGQYYDSRIHTAFRVAPKDIAQQRFLSSVERFRDPNDAK